MTDDLSGAPQGKIPIPRDTQKEEEEPFVPQKSKMPDMPVPIPAKLSDKPSHITPASSLPIKEVPAPKPILPPKPEIQKPTAPIPVAKPTLPVEPKVETLVTQPAPRPPVELPILQTPVTSPVAQKPIQEPILPVEPEILKTPTVLPLTLKMPPQAELEISKIHIEPAPAPSPKLPPVNLSYKPPIQKTSRELLDELLPMEEPTKKIVPKPSTTLPVKPMSMQDINQPATKERNIEEEIFPSPDVSEEIPTETPEELLGLGIESTEDELPSVPTPKMEIPEPILQPQEIPPSPVATPVQPIPQAQQVPQVQQTQKMQPMSPPPPPPPPPPAHYPTTTPTPANKSMFEHYKKFFMSKTVILTVLLIMIGATLVSASLYFIFSRDNGTGEIVEEEPKEQEPAIDTTPPKPLVEPDFVLENVLVEDTLESTLITALNKLKNAELTKDSIAYVPIRLEGVVIDNKAQYLKLQTFFSGLGIATPIEFFDVMESNFMLYLYTPGDEERIACQNNLVTEKDCWGPRLGMVFRVKPGYSHRLEPMLTQWMDLIKQYDSNLDRFILNSIAQMPQVPEFNEGTYRSGAVISAKEIKIHYANIPMPQYDNLELSGTALDLAVVNDMLIIATSKNSVRKIVDYILQQ